MVKMATAIADVGTTVRQYLGITKDTLVVKGVRAQDMPDETLYILCQYLSKALVVAIWSGSAQMVQSRIKRYVEDKREAEIKAQSGSDAGKPEEKDYKPISLDPQGIGGNQYANRVKVNMMRQLEKIVNEGAFGSGQQAVNAAKALLEQTGKIKQEALGVMEAYEKQLILLAGHIVENFLPTLGKMIKVEFQKTCDEVLVELKEKFESPSNIVAPQQGYVLWETSVQAVVRQFDRKKFELMFAESLVDHPRISEAFNLSKDLIDNYTGDDTVQVFVEDDAVKAIKEAQIKRDELNINLDEEDI